MTEELGRYEILEKIGQGGFAIVYRAKDTELDRLVALKELRPALLDDTDWTTRFKREARTIARLNHPRIVTIHDVVEVAQRLFIVMPLVDGSSLDNVIATQSGLPWSQAIEIMTAMADALDYAHGEDVLHRDLKPANILLDSKRGALLSDFGLAKLVGDRSLSQSGGIVGTPYYIAPEAWEGQPATPQVDIYALGCILYETLTGEKLFPGKSAPEVMRAHFKPLALPETWPEGVPSSVAEVLRVALAKQPGDRYPNAGEMAGALTRLVESEVQVSSVALPEIEKPKPSQNRHNLPVQTTPFVGREAELAELARLLNDPTIRLVTILGPGGMGKTRLALEAASAAIGAFPNGVYSISLAPLNSSDQIVPTLAEHFNFVFYGPDEPKQQLLDYMRQKQMLLVMDNFEHLLDGRDLVTEILLTAPEIRILATSRERLNLSGELVYALGTLALPPRPAPLKGEEAYAREWAGVEEYGAVKLLLQSARLVRPDLEPQTQDLSDVVHICHRVQGMPLALVLAAAWSEMLSFTEIAAEIEQSLDFLESQMHDMPARQRSVRATFDYSWKRLSKEEQETFTKLSVFRGGFTRRAVQTVTGASLHTLRALVNRSFIAIGREDRYEIHELLRQFGAGHLELSDQTDTTRDAHSDYYLNALHQRETDIKGHRQLEALDEIETDLENIRTAWNWALRRKNYAAINGSLESLYLFFERRGRFHEGAELFHLAREQLAPPPKDEPKPVWGRILARLGLLRSYLLTAREDIEADVAGGLAIAQKSGEQKEIAFCYFALGYYTSYAIRDLASALEYFEQSLQHYRALDDRFYMSRALQRIGYCHSQTTGLPNFQKFTGQGLELAREIGNKVDMAQSLSNLATGALGSGDYALAESYCQESIAIAREIAGRQALGHSTTLLGFIYFLQGDMPKAGTLAKEGLEIALDINFSLTKAYALATLGLWAGVTGDYVLSRQLGEESRAIPPNSFGFVLVDWALSIANCGLQNFEIAWQDMQTVLKYVRNFFSPAVMTWVLPVAAIILANEGKKERATELLALACNHPLSPTGWMEQWPLVTDLRGKLETELGPDVYQAAWARGKALDVEMVVAEWVKETEG